MWESPVVARLSYAHMTPVGSGKAGGLRFGSAGVQLAA